MIEVTIPIRTISEANSSEHWTAKAKRHRQQQFFVRSYFKEFDDKISVPCLITLIRLSPRPLDDDNLVSAFKYIRDELSELILDEKRTYKRNIKDKYGKIVRTLEIKVKGRKDSSDQIKWRYGQEKAKKQGIRIRIEDEATIR